jgi:hypothetical protein
LSDPTLPLVREALRVERSFADVGDRMRGVHTGGPDIVVQYSGSDATGWHEFRAGALHEWGEGWRDDANLFVVTPGAVASLIGAHPAPRLDEILVGSADEPMEAFPPFDLPDRARLIDAELATMAMRLVLRDSPFGEVLIDLGVERGALVAARLADDPLAASEIDLTLTVPFHAFIAFLSTAVDLPELVGHSKIEGEPAYLFLLVALLDEPALRAQLHRRRATAAGLWTWCAHVASLAWLAATSELVNEEQRP